MEKNNTLKSYSPSINRKLSVKSLKSNIPKKIELCDDLLKINLGNNKNPKCYNYDNKEVKKLLIQNLKSSKHLDPLKFRAPKQLYGNCWFNTMFVSFFFSDKGRKFFRFFREFMIKGKKIDNSIIEDEKLREMFFILNLFIEASYNQNYDINSNNVTIKNKNNIKNKVKNNIKNKIKINKKTIKKNLNKENLYNKISELTNNLNTNYYIKVIHDRINHLVYNELPKVDEAGNPLVFYKTLMNYLNYNLLKLMNLNIYENINIQSLLQEKFENYYKIPDIIILEDTISGNEKHNSDYELTYNLKQKNKNYKYVLDSIIITNKGHFKPRANSHFVSLATINKEEYKFDGDSYSRLSKFKWKSLINKDINWVFKENPNIYPEKYNFKHGYKILFYYRT